LELDRFPDLDDVTGPKPPIHARDLVLRIPMRQHLAPVAATIA